MSWLVTSRLGYLTAIRIRVGARIMSKCTAPVMAIAVNPSTSLIGVSLLEDIAAINERLLMFLLSFGGNLYRDGARTNTL
jgi:hypothetical protein